MPRLPQRTPPSLDLISLSDPRPVSSSPSPHVPHPHSSSPSTFSQINEKAAPLAHSDNNYHLSTTPIRQAFSPNTRGPRPDSSVQQSTYPISSSSRHFSQRGSYPLFYPTSSPSTYTRPRGLRIANLFRSWLPLILYALTSVAFVVAIALYRTELFAFLDELSLWLQSDEQTGYAILFCLIFLTTIPPIPLYSTFIILSGYTFGPWTGAIISYFAALTGALSVFVVSRALLRDSISRWLNSCTAIKRVVRAIEKRPKLLFLIRLAPYPYNVMNCLLAASPTLTLHTYTVCTALSLFKVIIHTSLGASIHSFKEYHAVSPGTAPKDDNNADVVAQLWTIIGIVLCISILVYLSVVARRAVDDELEDDTAGVNDSEETVAFLGPQSANDLETGHAVRGRQMTEVPSRSPQLMPHRPSHSVEPALNGQW
ncbi:hypothetical protein BDQ17DRAFT_1349141 [Cyathus striatus]|nr:hypothetical protein BDQ17DRAFT_1349141 [Cyathus striatus]